MSDKRFKPLCSIRLLEQQMPDLVLKLKEVFGDHVAVEVVEIEDCINQPLLFALVVILVVAIILLIVAMVLLVW